MYTLYNSILWQPFLCKGEKVEFIIVSFRSRTETMGFSKFLSDRGINNQIVNTPKSAGVGCGISVKTSIDNLLKIKKILSIDSGKTFAGIFSVKVMGGKQFTHRI